MCLLSTLASYRQEERTNRPQPLCVHKAAQHPPVQTAGTGVRIWSCLPRQVLATLVVVGRGGGWGFCAVSKVRTQ